MNQKTQQIFNYIILAFIILVFFQTCGVKNKIRHIENKTIENRTVILKQIDSVGNSKMSNEDIKDIIKETPAWETLRLEEISDKERISINLLKEKNNK